MQIWDLKGDNHAAQQSAAKRVGKLQETGVLGCKTSTARRGLAFSQIRVYHTGMWGWR